MPTLIPISRTVFLSEVNETPSDYRIFEAGIEAMGRVDKFLSMNDNVERVGETTVVRLCDTTTRQQLVKASAIVCQNSDKFGSN